MVIHIGFHVHHVMRNSSIDKQWITVYFCVRQPVEKDTVATVSNEVDTAISVTIFEIKWLKFVAQFILEQTCPSAQVRSR